MTEAVATIKGKRLDARYTLVDKLGAGGQGEVWRAHDGTRGVDIALKIVTPASGREEESWSALQHEYAIASKLDHPSILKVFPPEKSDEAMILPMELAAGGDLRRLRGAGFLEIIPVLLEIAQALEHAHERGVVHRDLKPGNVLFDARGRARLADFGVAEQAMTAAEANSSGLSAPATRDTNRHGFSPFTASPAQLRGEPPTPADDIYGLGALAYELLSGYPPYYPRFDKKRAIEERVPTLVPTRQIPPLLGSLVMNMLAKDPKRRPRTMREVIDELDAAINDTLTYDFENVSPATPTASVTRLASGTQGPPQPAVAGTAQSGVGAAQPGAAQPTSGANVPDARAKQFVWTPNSQDRRQSVERRGRRREDVASPESAPEPVRRDTSAPEVGDATVALPLSEIQAAFGSDFGSEIESNSGTDSKTDASRPKPRHGADDVLARIDAALERADSASRPKPGPTSPLTQEEAAAIVAAARAASSPPVPPTPVPSAPARPTGGYSAGASRPTRTTTHLLPPDSPASLVPASARPASPPSAPRTAGSESHSSQPATQRAGQTHAPAPESKRWSAEQEQTQRIPTPQFDAPQSPPRYWPPSRGTARADDSNAPPPSGPPPEPPVQSAAQAHMASPARGSVVVVGDGGPMHVNWDIPLDGLPKVKRLEPIKPRRWPWVFLGLLAGAAAAVFFWLPRFDTQTLPPEVAAVVTPLQAAITQSTASQATMAPAADTNANPPPDATNASVPEAANNEPAKAEPAKARISDEQRVREMRQTFDTRVAALEARGAGVWGGREFATAKTRAAESVGADDAGNPRVAQERLAAALKLLDVVDGKAAQALTTQVTAGEKALGAGQQEVAGQAFALARRINPADRRASDGQRRAQNLDAVLPLLADAQNAEVAHDYARAAQDYSQALSLDPGNAKAKAGQARANAAFGDDNYAKVVGSGFAALGAGRLDEAHDAFVKARALKPNGAEASEGLRRVSAALSARGFASMRQRALGLEAQERWEEAERVYEDVLAADPSLAFAQEGKARTSSRADLSIRLQQLLDRPDRLSTPSVRDDALALLETARAQSPQGPVIRSQIARLEILLPSLDKPVRLSLLSDNSTQIVIPSIGSFGAFARRDIELRPGKYTVVGTRNGFRDVRREITVAPGQEIQTIRVTCSDPI